MLNEEAHKPNLSVRPLIISIAGSSFHKRNSHVNRGNLCHGTSGASQRSQGDVLHGTDTRPA